MQVGPVSFPAGSPWEAAYAGLNPPWEGKLPAYKYMEIRLIGAGTKLRYNAAALYVFRTHTLEPARK